ncbi:MULTISPECIES: low affinity iron permease family protein [unclassified Cryobacterium]|nr:MULTISPECIES: low affinity iron permease family protein [unclassified Cryobacterium]
MSGQEPPRSTSPRHVPGGRERHWSSRFIHRVGDITAHASFGLTAAFITLLWLFSGLLLGFPAWWETVLTTVTATITLIMVFVIQHTQARQQAATQRKLDELLRALPTADNRLIAVEAAPDKELDDLADRNLTHREQAVHNATPQP